MAGERRHWTVWWFLNLCIIVSRRRSYPYSLATTIRLSTALERLGQMFSLASRDAVAGQDRRRSDYSGSSLKSDELAVSGDVDATAISGNRPRGVIRSMRESASPLKDRSIVVLDGARLRIDKIVSIGGASPYRTVTANREFSRLTVHASVWDESWMDSEGDADPFIYCSQTYNDSEPVMAASNLRVKYNKELTVREVGKGSDSSEIHFTIAGHFDLAVRTKARYGCASSPKDLRSPTSYYIIQPIKINLC
ncbi:hypothetical protein B0H21DRAFT_706856 [Amylocystis lapponica]|nr:hypothetical protein B0H21DRAFT_706856 [Amylocystis lapponica]